MSFWGAKIILAELSKSSRGCWGCWCRTDWETHLQMLSFKAKNWKLKKKKRAKPRKKTTPTVPKNSKKKSNFAAALLGWLFLVKSFLAEAAQPLFLPWGFPGVMGNCFRLCGNVFVFLYPLLCVNTKNWSEEHLQVSWRAWVHLQPNPALFSIIF